MKLMVVGIVFVAVLSALIFIQIIILILESSKLTTPKTATWNHFNATPQRDEKTVI